MFTKLVILWLILAATTLALLSFSLSALVVTPIAWLGGVVSVYLYQEAKARKKFKSRV